MYKKISKKHIVGIGTILFFIFITIYNINQNKIIETINLYENKKYVYPLGNIVGIKATTSNILD